MATEAKKAVFISYASDDREAALKICESLRSAGVEVWFDMSELRGGDAWDASIRGDMKTALKWIERAYEVKDPGLAFMKADPMLEPIRREPRFQAVVRKLNFPE
jgi:hypothetical protein